MLERGDVETREMEDLENFAVLEESLQARRFIVRSIGLDQMSIAVARRQLHQAQLVAQGIESERFGIDGDLRSEIEPRRQIAFVDLYGHPSVDFAALIVINAGCPISM